ncbi:hypothetical protein [Pseudoalteromonas marina]|uniref:Uncharacterized protein n=1 Tax=Pseudoalteromonas marina TaxID=267375 RepID=A0ABT9FI59_9GAMM|nr:hypothetical protein [Pseudoalteromonas marina]MDP2566441.1 hypothetical protein [Pseudoalteromonas marina]
MIKLNNSEISLLRAISQGKSNEDISPASDSLNETLGLGYLISREYYRYTPSDQSNAIELCKQYT